MNVDGDNLVDLAVQGDDQALDILLNRHGPAVRRKLGRIPPQWQALLAADDVMQQTYADAFERVGGFHGDCELAFAAWLETTARRNLRDALKMLKALKRGGDRLQVMLGDPLGGTTPSRLVAKKEAETALQSAVSKLSEDYAQVVRLYDLEGRPAQEVAAAFQRSVGAMFMLRLRAHERLRALMGRASDYFSGSA